MWRQPFRTYSGAGARRHRHSLAAAPPFGLVIPPPHPEPMRNASLHRGAIHQDVRSHPPRGTTSRSGKAALRRRSASEGRMPFPDAVRCDTRAGRIRPFARSRPRPSPASGIRPSPVLTPRRSARSAGKGGRNHIPCAHGLPLGGHVGWGTAPYPRRLSSGKPRLLQIRCARDALPDSGRRARLCPALAGQPLP